MDILQIRQRCPARWPPSVHSSCQIQGVVGGWCDLTSWSTAELDAPLRPSSTICARHQVHTGWWKVWTLRKYSKRNTIIFWDTFVYSVVGLFIFCSTRGKSSSLCCIFGRDPPLLHVHCSYDRPVHPLIVLNLIVGGLSLAFLPSIFPSNNVLREPVSSTRIPSTMSSV